MFASADTLRAIKNFDELVRYLEEELDWPLQEYEFDELTFEYLPAELGLKDEDAVKVRRIHQLRPLEHGQPWGVFFVEFEKKKLPVVVLRRILSHLVVKKRAAASNANAAAWDAADILFISAFGDEAAAEREIAFAHFHQEGGDLPTLRVLGWDGGDTPLKLDHVAATLQSKLQWPTDTGNHAAWREQWSQAFRHRYGHVIRTADVLAEVLAALARNIRTAAQTIIQHETERGPLRRLHRAFQTALIHDLTEEDFADTYAQTITYGLLTAAISRTEMTAGRHGTALIAENVADIVPVTNPFLKEMLQTFLKLGGRKGSIDFDELGIQDVVDLLRGDETDLPAILRDFGNRTRGEDPVIHFYEHFLAAYNKKLKVQRGVFYTPQPVVSYIVRSVHELLQTEFGLEDGLADITTWGEMAEKFRNPQSEFRIPEGVAPDSPFVQILDPATGTATFLVEVIEVIHRTLTDKWKQQGLNEAARRAAWNEYVPQHLLPRLHGYELMMAPYAIAHMKLPLKLKETGFTAWHKLGDNDRARIYLTNALEPPSDVNPKLPEMFPALAHEAAAVNEVKRNKRFTVVIGNPPYAGTSSNFGEWISRLVNDYYFIEGKPLRERNPKYLQDDYVKFIRLGQYLLHQAECGAFSFITNHGYITNPTFRGMRHSVLQEFNCWETLDLHGSTKRKEQAVDGTADENVFDIQQGVAIFRALKSLCPAKAIHHADIYGDRASKYKALSGSSSNGIEWKRVSAVAPFYLFQPQDADVRNEYYAFTSIAELMPLKNYGFKTHRDNYAISFTQEELESRLAVLRGDDLSDDKLLEEFGLSETVDWKIANVRRALRANKDWKSPILKCCYRPFDYRFCYLSSDLMDRPRFPFMNQMLASNLALATTRAVEIQRGFEHIGCVTIPMDHHAVSLKESNFLFPLYVYPTGDKLGFAMERYANFAPIPLKSLYHNLGLTLSVGKSSHTDLTPEDIFQYIYAIFHSLSYRNRYAEFLKIDFPRLPLTSSLELFRALAQLGSELIALHLVEFALEEETNAPADWPRYNRLARFTGTDRSIEKFPAADKAWKEGRVSINASSGFEGVPEEVWKFHIGGYQVCHKWLKDRKGRSLSDEDILHYGKIVTALNETIRLMRQIDEVIHQHGGWPGAFAPAEAAQPE